MMFLDIIYFTILFCTIVNFVLFVLTAYDTRHLGLLDKLSYRIFSINCLILCFVCLVNISNKIEFEEIKELMVQENV